MIKINEFKLLKINIRMKWKKHQKNTTLLEQYQNQEEKS